MNGSIKIVLALVMSLVLLIPTNSILAAQQNNNEQSKDITTPIVPTTFSQNGITCSSNQTNQNITIQQLPGDYLNSCKIVATKKYDNVKYTDWENKIIPAIAGGVVGVIGNYIAQGPLKAFVFGAMTTVYLNYPKSKPVYVTIQHRQCKDSLGYHRQLIIKSYKDKKRTKHISTQYKWVS
ncbi:MULTISPECIES: hypothetical protein [Bacillus subtilis group]|uniref:Putative transmembrane protein n=5 Tax=Bacillaceae TaxID=186817 RepID=Q5MCL6_BACIU|nr:MULTISPECIES: hypothetical protein [Bacillus subtilis group]AAW02708.1 putative transmembrane protein [Bacillus subtilis]AAZ73225.1 Rep [Bacillus subtilis]ATI23358.1 hypothetical protein CLD04_21530 [Bacillus subtilis]KAF2423535.1 hypothetical protein B6K89_15880 [Bacillus subtilis]MDL0429472.1 hypothetical protein [Bacillus amyloliquefaciens]